MIFVGASTKEAAVAVDHDKGEETDNGITEDGDESENFADIDDNEVCNDANSHLALVLFATFMHLSQCLSFCVGGNFYMTITHI